LVLVLLLTGFNAFADAQIKRDFSDKSDLAPDDVVSGLEFLTESTRQLQQDSFANPGLLWVDQGKALFEENAGVTSCRSCHDTNLAGAFARFPAYDDKLEQLVNIEGRINQCRTKHQSLPALAYESAALLSLTAYVASLSNGLPFNVSIEDEAREYYDRGRAYFFQRRGQLNLACTQCHDDNWGRMLRGDKISQGHSNAYPGYRMEWQSFGSLHRRIRDCDTGVRARPYAAGAQPYLELELYLAWRAAELPIESPGVRR
jgi:sulfur-oxidizing protein SoxA